MIDPRHEDLLHKQLDGEATPAEAAELAALLTADPELRARREQLVRLFEVLASSPPPEPTEDLRERILQGVRALPVHRPRPSWSESVRRLFQPGWRPLAYFAAGAVAGAVLLAAFVPRLVQEDGAAGTLLLGGATASTRLIAEEERRLGGGTAICRVRAAAGTAWAEVDLRADGPATIELQFDREALLPTGVSFSPPGATIAMDTERVRIDNASRGIYRVAFSMRAAAAAGIAFTIEAGATTVEARLPTRAPGGAPSP